MDINASVTVLFNQLKLRREPKSSGALSRTEPNVAYVVIGMEQKKRIKGFIKGIKLRKKLFSGIFRK